MNSSMQFSMRVRATILLFSALLSCTTQVEAGTIPAFYPLGFHVSVVPDRPLEGQGSTNNQLCLDLPQNSFSTRQNSEKGRISTPSIGARRTDPKCT